MVVEKTETKTWSRRSLLITCGLAAISTVFSSTAEGTPADAEKAIREISGDRTVKPGRVTVTLPPIAENGNSVLVNIAVDSPMTENDYVRQIVVISPRNPIATIARFRLGPDAGKAELSTRIRMAGTQTLRVIAEMSDGSLWSGTGSTYVTLAACVIG